MPFTCKIGDTLRISDSGGRHHYVILTNSNSDGNVVVVNFTTARYWKEWIVDFTKKDNRKLFKKKTTVNYADARIISAKKLLAIANRKSIDDYIYCAENIIKEIIIGAFQSQFTPIEIIEELSIQYPNEYKKHYEQYC
jgi:hypothetical protein